MELNPRGGNLPEIPRVGMTTAVVGRLSNVRWFGRGPHENYSDRKAGAPVGLYTLEVGDMNFHLARPQENGYRTDVRWFELSGRGPGLKVTGDGLLCFSAWPYTMEDLEAAWHPHELPRRTSITVCVDLVQLGLGGDTAWGARPHPEYTSLPNREYRYRFRLSRN
jgi:beta-galactosidase